MAEEDTSPALRLAEARLKIRSFQRQVDALLGSDFPHKDSRVALVAILSKTKERIKKLEDMSGLTNIEISGENLAGISEYITENMNILGMILRSTNVRNPFELYFPFKRLAKTLLDGNVKLLMSSEWDFVPFTYPMNVEILSGRS